MNVRLADMYAAVGEAEEVLKALANRHRLLLLCEMSSGEKSVGELAEVLGLRNSTVSQHLALLRKDGLVSTRRDGQTIWYSITSEPALRLIETLYGIYCGRKAIRAQRPAAKGRKQKASR